jgi:hypothetical protein
VTLAACLLLAAGCSSGGPARGVAVRSINTSVGLGIDVGASAAPANIAAPPARQQSGNPPQIFPTYAPAPFPVYTPEPKLKCPAAGPFDFPAKEAGVQPTGRPVAASYAWKIDGSVDNGNGPTAVDTSEVREIKNIQDASNGPGAFTFTQTQTYLVDGRKGVLTTTFLVVPNSPAQTSSTNADVGRGMFIQSISFDGRDAAGQEDHTTFAPRPAVQMAAFPFVQGDGVAGSTPPNAVTGARQPITSSSGTDPSTGNRLTLDGTVDGKQQIDACGKKVDAWLVKTTESYTYTNSKTQQTNTLQSTYDYAIAPQYGSLLVFEHTEAPKDGPVVVISARIGRVPSGPKGS